jgi:phosphoglycolate phosphatase
MLLQAMGATGATPRDTVMIGDTTYDVLMGVAAGVPVLGVGWGYHAPAELAAAGAAALAVEYGALPAAVETLLMGSSGTER